MASDALDVTEKFTSLLKDVENFYADRKDNDESHKVRALQYFSQSEIDQYCEMTFSLESFKDQKKNFQNKVLTAKATIAKLQEKSAKLKETITQFEASKAEDKSADKKLDLDAIKSSILAAQAGIEVNDRRIGFCRDEINTYQPQLEEGEKLALDRDKLIETMKSKFSSKNN